MTDALTVIGVAIIQDGVTWNLMRPNRHHDVILMMHDAKAAPLKNGHKQGFVLSDGSYASRRGAAEIALRAGQVELDALLYVDELFSEDVW